MTMELIGPGGEEQFNLTVWKMLLDLALGHGWRPAGASEPVDEDEDEEVEESGESAEPEMAAAACELPQELPLPEAIRSLFPSTNDPVLMSYFINGGFRVSAEDASALADALERALPDVPDHDAMEHKTFTHPSEPGVRFVSVKTPVNPFEWFSGKKDRLRDFIAFCRQGGFEIW